MTALNLAMKVVLLSTAAILLVPFTDLPVSSNVNVDRGESATRAAAVQQPVEREDKLAAINVAEPLPGNALKGTVQKIELDLGVLRDIGLDLKHILKAIGSLYEEVTIQPVSLVTEPEIIGAGTIIYVPVGTMPVGLKQPARKERVDLAMNQITPLVTVLKKNVDEFVTGQKELDLPDDVLSELKPQIQRWVEMVEQANAQLKKLQQLTQNPPYDNDTIATVVTSMQTDIKQLDKTRREIYKVIRKEGKRVAQRLMVKPAPASRN